MGNRIAKLESLVWLSAGLTLTAYLVGAALAEGSLSESGQPLTIRLMRWALLAIGPAMVAWGAWLCRASGLLSPQEDRPHAADSVVHPPPGGDRGSMASKHRRGQ